LCPSKRARDNNPSSGPDLDVNEGIPAAAPCPQKRARHTGNNLSMELNLGVNKGTSTAVMHALRMAGHSNLASQEPDLGVNKEISAVPDCDIVPEIEALPAPESPPASFSFSGRRRKVPCALKDYIPHSLVGLPSHLHPVPPKPMLCAEPEVPSLAPIPDPEPEADPGFTTEPNGFGLYRQYTRKPQTDPENRLTLADLADDDMPEQHHSGATAANTSHSTTVDFFYPFSNVTVYRYINWFLGISGTLSAADLDCLARDMISSDDFNPKDL